VERKKHEQHSADGKLHGMLKRTCLLPTVRHAVSMALTLPVTTCTAERLFSTLQQAKTWLRLTKSDKRLSVSCVMSGYLEKTSKDKQYFIKKVIDRWTL